MTVIASIVLKSQLEITARQPANMYYKTTKTQKNLAHKFPKYYYHSQQYESISFISIKVYQSIVQSYY